MVPTVPYIGGVSPTHSRTTRIFIVIRMHDRTDDRPPRKVEGRNDERRAKARNRNHDYNRRNHNHHPRLHNHEQSRRGGTLSEMLFALLLRLICVYNQNMGQSTSLPNKKSNNFIKNDLFQLEEYELEILLGLRPLGIEEVRMVSCSVSCSFGKENNEIGSSFYAQEADSPEAQLAIKINSLSRDLSKLRFHLVPSKLKEPVFWETIFTLLRERLVEYSARHLLAEAEQEERTRTSLTKSMLPRANTIYFPDDEVDLLDEVCLDDDGGEEEKTSLQEKLALRNSQVLCLRQQVNDLRKEIKLLRASAGTAKVKETPKHKGTWVMDQDSLDFIGYPEELKDNMRKEKQKRLEHVKRDMKFILDSDDVEDSNGVWNCCGATEYKHKCNKI